MGSNAALMRRMSSILAGSSSAWKYRFFSVPMPCSPEMTPPRSMLVRNSSSITRAADLGVGLEHREVDVAVAGVAAAGDPGAVGVGDLDRTLAMNSAIARRGTAMSTMSSAWLALATQNAFSRASISWVAAPGGRT